MVPLEYLIKLLYDYISSIGRHGFNVIIHSHFLFVINRIFPAESSIDFLVSKNTLKSFSEVYIKDDAAAVFLKQRHQHYSQ
jgi:hypothetical protein